MSKYLVIVESPAKAKTIEKYLGKNYKVTASMGHVRDLPKSQLGIDVENDFAPKYIQIRGKSDLIKSLKKEVKQSEHIFLATDPDREGEAISWHLMNTLGISPDKAKRIVFNEITKDAVRNAIKEPRDINYSLVDAQQARRILDRIVGYKISPLLWRKVKRGLSAGRVQSVTLKIICDRESEVIKFIPEEYWTINANLLHNNSNKVIKAEFYGDKKGKIKLESEEAAQAILDKLKNVNYVVDSVKKSRKKKQPAPPFITSTLQQEASRKLDFAAARTMRAAQQLYEGVNIKGEGLIGLITYMRTDSIRIAAEAATLAKNYIIGKWGVQYAPENLRQYKNKKNAQDAHEAIRPSIVNYTPLSIKDSLSSDQFKLYKLIWERFIASQMEDADVEVTNISISAGDYVFKTKGEIILFAGFTTLYTEGVDIKEGEEDEGIQKLPNVNEKDTLIEKNILPKQHFTQAPPRYTEATLIRTLEEKGIGRPSTYAPIITTIIARNYVVKEKKNLVPTELGMVVNDLMSEYFQNIVDVDFTANMESQLDLVEEGKANWVQIIRDFYGPFDIVLKNAEANIEQVVLEPEVSDVVCDKCGTFMIIRDGRFGKFLACPKYPECKNTKSITISIGVKCPKCDGDLLEKKSQKKVKYFGCVNNPTCDFLSWDMPTDEKCPVCGEMLLKKSIKGRIINTNKVCIDKECKYNKKEKTTIKSTTKAKSTTATKAKTTKAKPVK